MPHLTFEHTIRQIRRIPYRAEDVICLEHLGFSGHGVQNRLMLSPHHHRGATQPQLSSFHILSIAFSDD